MLEIAYKIDHTDVIASGIAKTLGIKLDDSGFEVSNEIMEARAEFYRLTDGLSVQISRFEQYDPVQIKRLGTNNPDLLILDFHLTGVAKLNFTDDRIDGQLHNGLTHGAYFASAEVQSYATFPSGFYNEQLHIVMDKGWIKDFFSDEIESILQRIETAQPFFMYERLNGRLTALLMNIFKSNEKENFRKSFLHGKILEVLSLFFSQLQRRGENLEFGVSNYGDISRLFDLMLFIDNHLGEDLNLDLLSNKVGFSESKLQKLSKAVLGNSLSKEITERRMLKALELLGSNQYSVSEIGHMVGYNNMSHFAKTFKKVHGLLPSKYIKKTLNVPN